MILTSLKERISWNLGYMKEMVGRDSLRFDKNGRFIESASLVDIKSKTLGEYYINSRNLVTHYHLWAPTTTLDENGVTRNDYSRWGHNDAGIRYSATFVAQFALGNFELFLDTGNADYRKAFFAQVDWLMENAQVTGTGAAVWEFDYTFTSHYNFSIPWVSAMTQGLVISVLVRAYQLTDEEKYRDLADGALRSFHVSMEQGGATWTDPEGLIFYEEYPSDPPCHVLNGHIWAMFGLYDHHRATGSKDALDLFNAGVDTLKKYMPCFDTGFWSRYDLLRKPGYAQFRYHFYHIELLKVIYGITGDEFFNDYVRRWGSYLKPWRRAYFAFRVALFRLSEIRQNRRNARVRS